MIHSRDGDKRSAKRFHIECLVTISIRDRGQTRELQGRLYDIGDGGARVYLNKPLEVGTRLIMHVHFPNPRKGVTIGRFEGVVAPPCREPQHDISIQFRRCGRFLQDGSGPPSGYDEYAVQKRTPRGRATNVSD